MWSVVPGVECCLVDMAPPPAPPPLTKRRGRGGRSVREGGGGAGRAAAVAGAQAIGPRHLPSGGMCGKDDCRWREANRRR